MHILENRKNQRRINSIGFSNYKKQFALLILANLIFSMLAIVATFYFGYSINKLFSSFSFHVIKYILIYAIIELLCLVSRELYEYVKGRVFKYIISDIRKLVISKALDYNYDSFNYKGQGYFLSTLTQDMKSIEKGYYGNIIQIISYSIRICVIFGILTSFNIILGAVVLVTTVFTLLFPDFFGTKINKISTDQVKATEGYTAKYKNDLMGFETYTINNKKNTMISNLLKANKNFEDSRLSYSIKYLIINSLIHIVRTIANGINYFTCIILAITGLVPLGYIVSSTEFISRFTAGVQTIIESYQGYLASKTIINKIEDIINYKPIELKEPLPEFSNSIVFENVSFSYSKEQNLLKNINLSFRKNKKYAIVGESGKGKTTLINLLLRIIEGYEGNIYFDSHNIIDYDTLSLCKQIAYVDQHIYLFNDSIKNNIFFDNPYQDEIIHKSGVYGFASQLPDGLDYIINDNGSNLSGGQKQKIALARALVAGKKIIILDESFAAIDKENFVILEKNILEDTEITYITITHQLYNENLFNKIYHLDKGEKHA